MGYSYYEQKGFWVAVAARVTNLLALGFTAAFSGFLLLWVDWGALNADCLRQDACDILDVRRRRPSTPLERICQRLADADSVLILRNVRVLVVVLLENASVHEDFAHLPVGTWCERQAEAQKLQSTYREQFSCAACASLSLCCLCTESFACHKRHCPQLGLSSTVMTQLLMLMIRCLIRHAYYNPHQQRMPETAAGNGLCCNAASSGM